MRRVVSLGLICFALSSVTARPDDRHFTFTGEAFDGRVFRKGIGRGLDFVLMPDSEDGGDTGWTIEITPQVKPPQPGCKDFLWVVTPPYHFENVRYLDTSYGVTAQEAVRNSPRQFNFVLNRGDCETESKRVDLVLYGYTAPQKEADEALAKLGTSPLGTGRLWIVDSRITPGRGSAQPEDVGKIHWIKFKVEIEFPPALPAHAKRSSNPDVTR